VVVQYDLKDSTADPVDVDMPWWSVFVKKSVDSDDVHNTISAELAATPWEKVDNSGSMVLPQKISHTLHSISNILKTKHDTAKNSISNVR
jgi:hypothetical protein